MKLIFKSITIKNFKGIKDLSINLNESLTNIRGDNALGKTTIFDAFTFLLFGKDSSGRKDFNIKNTVHTELNRQDHEVSAIFYHDGEENEIKRIFKEKHVKKRGSNQTEFQGHEQEFFWNGVPCNLKEFTDKVNSLVDENIFKLVSNPYHFNSLHWKERREVLISIAGHVSDSEIAESNPNLSKVLGMLTHGKTLDDLKKQVASKKKLIKEQLEKIPTRIDEVSKSKPEPLGFDEIREEIEDTKSQINEIDLAISDKSKKLEKEFEKYNETQKQIYELKTKISAKENVIKSEFNNKVNSLQFKLSEENGNLSVIDSNIRSIKIKKDGIDSQIESLRLDIAAKRKDYDDLRDEWIKENEKELAIDPHVLSCSECKRSYEGDSLEEIQNEMESNFLKNKKEKLQKLTERITNIQDQGKRLAATLKELEEKNFDEELAKLNKAKEVQEKVIAEIQMNIDKESETPFSESIYLQNADYVKMQGDLLELESSQVDKPEIDNSRLLGEKSQLDQSLEALYILLRSEKEIEKADLRIKELTEEERTLSNELSEHEGDEFLINEFSKAKIDSITNRVNSMFELVKFKMFDEQINGGETETCEAMIDNVPYPDLNNAAKINAGLDIINALSKYYNVYVPCFVDNAESVTKLHPTNSQIIRLVVDESAKKLTIQ